MKTNLVIATYAAKYSVMNKKNYLKYNLSLINDISTNLTQITIMKPKLDGNQEIYTDYYNLDDINISNIKDKIKIIECDNIGISYGQFFTAINYNNDFDYHFFIEDDYTVFSDYFEEYMINEINKYNEDIFLCMFYFKNKKWNMYEYIQHRESQHIHDQFVNKIALNTKYNSIMSNFKNDMFFVPDNTFGGMSKKSYEKILNTFDNFDNIISIFDVKFRNIWIHQILFGYMLFLSGVKVCDISDKNVNLFYHTGSTVTMCNYGSDLQKWKEYPYNNEKLKIPVFCPIEFFYPYNHEDTIQHLKKYFIDYEEFINQFNKLNTHMKELVTTLP